MKAAVVDASVAAKWVLDEEGSAAAASLRSGILLFAPGHWLGEVAAAVCAKFRRGELTADDVPPTIMVLEAAPVREIAISTIIGAATDIALRCQVTVYDALYVALAVRRGIPLITADRKLCDRLRVVPEFAGVAIALDDLPISQ